ncbi:DUF5324 family protein [Streptomyces aidingensis]|uniref:Nosiheptide resistance regulatory protein n=1 Tax=Streptomyces aidingensis TaxID=910347 RepID=A0A1I1QM24_9ACTN|nr:DUF5324 family protein [Streptomyces aidingensis]SFD23075.1 hypothetical protein SAMN05421773_111174 [Streptomyces aidingensis]
MTRNGRVRAATGSARENMWRAAQVVGPYAVTARDSATHYAHQAGAYLKPRAQRMALQARMNYDTHLAPRMGQMRQSLPEGMDRAATRAAERARIAARRARETTGPRIEYARATVGPAREEAAARSAAAMAAFRGGVTAREITRLARRKQRRARAGRMVKWLGLGTLVSGGALAAWRWWERQTNPDWLVEPAPPTEVAETSGTAEESEAVDGVPMEGRAAAEDKPQS